MQRSNTASDEQNAPEGSGAGREATGDTGAAIAVEAGPRTDAGSDTPAPAIAARLTLIEDSVQAPLSTTQRRLLLERLKESERGWPAEEVARVPDGTEPGFVFHPRPRNGGRKQQKRPIDG